MERELLVFMELAGETVSVGTLPVAVTKSAPHFAIRSVRPSAPPHAPCIPSVDGPRGGDGLLALRGPSPWLAIVVATPRSVLDPQSVFPTGAGLNRTSFAPGTTPRCAPDATDRNRRVRCAGNRRSTIGGRAHGGHPIGQRPGMCGQACPDLDGDAQALDRIHRAWLALRERLRGELQYAISGCTAQPEDIHVTA